LTANLANWKQSVGAELMSPSCHRPLMP
jgi:hypothetical protein